MVTEELLTVYVRSMMLLGNLFSRPLPKWVPDSEQQASFLSVDNGFHFSSEVLPLYFTLTLLIGVTVLIFIPSVWFLYKQAFVPFYTEEQFFHVDHRDSTLTRLSQMRKPSSFMIRGGGSSLSSNSRPSMRKSVRNPLQRQYHPVTAFLLTTFKMVSLIGTFTLLGGLSVFTSSANWYLCGDSWIKYTTIAYLCDSEAGEWASAIMCCLYSCGCGACMYFILTCGRKVDTIHRGENEPPSNRTSLAESVVPEGEVDGEVVDGEGFDANLRVTHSSPDASISLLSEFYWPSFGGAGTRSYMFHFCSTLITRVVWFMVWLMAIIAMSIPTILYVLTYSLPENNTIDLSVNQIKVLHSLVFLHLVGCVSRRWRAFWR